MDIDRPSTEDKGDGAAAGQENGTDGTDGDAAGEGEVGADEEDDDIQLPSFKKRHADGESPTPEPQKKKKMAKKGKPSADGAGAGGVGPDGAELPLDPLQEKMSKLDRDFDLAIKSGKSTSRRRKKDDEDIDTELDESAARFVAKMQEAAFADIDVARDRQTPSPSSVLVGSGAASG